MKTIKISDDVHFIVKNYTNDHNLKMNKWIEYIIVEYLEKNGIK
jgi:hypothetical protein